MRRQLHFTHAVCKVGRTRSLHVGAVEECPGAVDTPMDEKLKEDPQRYHALLREILMRRMAQPQEIADLAVYLASDDAAYVTGASYFIDGG